MMATLGTITAEYLINVDAGRIQLASGGFLLLETARHLTTPAPPLVTRKTQITSS